MATQQEIEIEIAIRQANVRRLDAHIGRIDDLLDEIEELQAEQERSFDRLTDTGDVLRKASEYGIGCLVVA
jgi:t-SNARE complex subunit (syntaxin)